MKENILICLIFLACAFSAGVMVAGGLLPATVLYTVIGGVVLVSTMALFVGGLIAVVWLFKRTERPQHPEPLPTYRSHPDRLPVGQSDRPGIDYTVDLGSIGDGYLRRDRREIETPTRRAISWRK